MVCRAELDARGGGNVDGLTGLRIATLTRRALGLGEGAEADQAEAAVGLHTVDDGGQHGLDGGIGLGDGAAGGLTDGL